MNTEDHIKVLDGIVRGIGTMTMEYWTDATEKRAQIALEHLSSIARQAEHLRMRIGADDNDTLIVAVQKVLERSNDDKTTTSIP